MPAWHTRPRSGKKTAAQRRRLGESKVKDRAAALRQLSAFIALFAFWVANSGYFTPFLLLAGAGSAAAVLWFARRMDVIDAEGHPIHLILRVGIYWAWLFKEIVKSAWDVSRIIVHPRLPISPTLVRLRPTQKTSVGLVLYANSITLTPGTITVEAEPEEFLVHSLTRAGALSLAEGDMDRRVTLHEGRP
jgi:multicomponent Na+:H+ antiporter subunit E